MTQPTRRDRYRPAEFLGLSAVLALFSGVVALISTRDLMLAIIIFGIVFILALVTIALLILAVKPDEEERHDLDEQNTGH